MNTEPTAKLLIGAPNAETQRDAERTHSPLNAETKDEEWGRVLWDWLREMLPDAGCCLEFDTEELMKLAEKHGRAKKVKYDPRIHKEICDVDPGEEIWWWGDDIIEAAVPALAGSARWCKHIERDYGLQGQQWRMAGGDWHAIPRRWKFCPFCGKRKPKLPMGRPNDQTER